MSQQTAVTLNPRYAVPRDADQLTCTQVPAGTWAVKVRQHGDQTTAYAVPRHTTTGRAFVLATGTNAPAVFGAAIRWTSQAKTLTCRMDRVVFAGYGNATHEQTTDLDGLAAVTDTVEAR
ncbi:hypothetical protein E1211_17860 [Micromonospora sp. 15K316]|uniref:hypothetical protein n=1 Tax=Micromonospora sp. 15K316 TaxID=2530376 RepID=UPI0010434522|nr:hypothetical protein [Micromonospora sp. 15K316]TDC34213.1 hypothetical protein E1211_17860 [Micromonospora sp. 15K316]